MQSYKIGKKFPWKTLMLAILVGVLVICLFGVLFIGADAFFGMVAGAFIGAALGIADIAWACVTNLFFWAGFGIMGIAFFVYFYRKNYAKKTVIATPGLSSVGARDALAEPSLFNSDEMKVESA